MVIKSLGIIQVDEPDAGQLLGYAENDVGTLWGKVPDKGHREELH